MYLENMEIIGSSGCPYVQRVLALLIETHTPFKYRNIDLSNKPEWLLEKSPFGRVPFLLLPDGKFLFESIVINEYIYSILPTNKELSPHNDLTYCENKAWIEYLGSIFTEGYIALTKPTKAEFEAVLPAISQKYALVNKQITGPFWNGDKISLIDFAAAPLLQRFWVLDKITGVDIGDKAKYPKLKEWMDKLSSHPSVNLAATLQAEFPAVDPRTIYSQKVDTEKILKIFEENFRKNFHSRFPASYLNALLTSKL